MDSATFSKVVIYLLPHLSPQGFVHLSVQQSFTTCYNIWDNADYEPKMKEGWVRRLSYFYGQIISLCFRYYEEVAGAIDGAAMVEVVLDDVTADVMPTPDVAPPLTDVASCISRRTILDEKPGKFGKRIPISRATFTGHDSRGGIGDDCENDVVVLIFIEEVDSGSC
uniref:Uncharacterized protein n=1 Tax=Setaria digitata TaxID=48799 RepID=A0A915PSC7_9BILA